MADEIKEGLEGASVEIVEGSGGVFEVTVDGGLIYSKKESMLFKRLLAYHTRNIKPSVGREKIKIDFCVTPFDPDLVQKLSKFVKISFSEYLNILSFGWFDEISEIISSFKPSLDP